MSDHESILGHIKAATEIAKKTPFIMNAARLTFGAGILIGGYIVAIDLLANKNKESIKELNLEMKGTKQELAIVKSQQILFRDEANMQRERFQRELLGFQRELRSQRKFLVIQAKKTDVQAKKTDEELKAVNEAIKSIQTTLADLVKSIKPNSE